jgi:hypothetical protein
VAAISPAIEVLETVSVAETLVHIALLPRAAYLLHVEKSVATLEGFDFGELIMTSEIEGKCPRSKKEILELLGAKESAGANGWRRFQKDGWPNRCACLAALRKADSSCCSRRKNTRCIIGRS